MGSGVERGWVSRWFPAGLLALVLAGRAFASGAGPAGRAPMLFEVEEFPAQGQWTGENDRECLGRGCLRGGTERTGLAGEALTIFSLGEPGRFDAWVRSKNYLQNLSGRRRFAIAIDGRRGEKEAGQHGREGWAWERVASFDLGAGPHVLSLIDTSKAYGRCDAILLGPVGFDPSKLNKGGLSKFHVRLDGRLTVRPELRSAGALAPGEFKPAAEVRGDRLRVGFAVLDGDGGGRVLARRVELAAGGAWSSLPTFVREALFVVSSPTGGVDPKGLARPDHPTWPARGELSLPDGRSVRLTGLTENPFLTGEIARLDPVTVKQAGPGRVFVSYAGKGISAEGRWSAESGGDLRLEVEFSAPSDGLYSVGLCAFDPLGREGIEAVQLPPLYQYQRVPEAPCAVTSSITPNPLALVQHKIAGAGVVTWGVGADPADLPFRWSSRTNAVYAFSLLNAGGEVQPTVFEPVLGFEGSSRKAGEIVRSRFRLLAVAGDWKVGLDSACRGIFGVRDYRAPVRVSLTAAVRNMKRLMEDDAASGWDAAKLGFYDIETAAMSKQAAPLVMLSLARLFGDEDFWKRRALPTIEFTLSRRTSHCIHADKDRNGNPVRDQLKVPTDFYGTAYWQGVDWLTGGLNPWLKEFILPGGAPKVCRGYNSAPAWTEELAAWRYTRDAEWLQKAREGADKFISEVIHGPSTAPVSFDAFYNIHFYPYWWELVDLFEATGERRYLDAANEGAYQTLAGLWSHPPIPPGELTVHAGGQQGTPQRVWWRDGKPFRLGWPRQPNDTPEHAVPAWRVAQVGLGLEQPSTLTAFPGEMMNIMMSCWAPHLLRVHQHAGGELLLAQARNGVIGRFANYPGYYLTAFTDLVHDPQYPYRGPDVTSIYYHHIPVQAGWALDFLVAQLAQRSCGRVNFPYAVQKNYAWFTFRVYGGGAGRAFEDGTARMVFDPEGIARVDNPMIDWLCARGEDRYWVFLMNQSDREVEARVVLDLDKLAVKGGAAWRLRDEAGGAREMAGEHETGLAVPAKGFRAIEVPCRSAPVAAAVSPLAAGHVRASLGGAWGDVHAFRIRSPFGSDCAYAVVLAGDQAHGAVEFEFGGKGGRRERDVEAPYEFSVYPVDAGLDTPIKVRAMDASGKVVGTAEMVLGRN